MCIFVMDKLGYCLCFVGEKMSKKAEKQIILG